LARGGCATRHHPARDELVSGARVALLRGRPRGDRAALALLQRAVRGSDVLGAARPGRPLRPAAGSPPAAAARGGGRGRAGRARRAGDGVIEAWRRVLVLAPHTDDGEFGCGGTMARLVEAGAEVRYVAF